MRTITRPITRRIDNLVIRITEEGITLRKFRAKAKRTAKTIPWNELAMMAGANIRRSRADAFMYEPMPGWMPKPGDRVWLHPKKNKFAQGTVATVHPALPEAIFTVDVNGGSGKVLLSLKDLRPAPAKVEKRTEGQKDLVPLE